MRDYNNRVCYKDRAKIIIKMIRIGNHLRLLLKPSRVITKCFNFPQPMALKYAMSTSQQQKIFVNSGRENQKDIFLPGQKILQQYPQGYGYYDWNNEANCYKAMQDDYHLNDLIIGFRILKNKKIQYNEQHLAFMAYIMVLFPFYQAEISKDFLPAFIRIHEMPDSHKKLNRCVSLVKSLCYDPKWRDSYSKSEELIHTIHHYLKKRVLHPENRKSLECIHKNISINCFQDMGGLQEIFEDLKRIFYAECIETKFKVSPKTIKLTVSIFQKLMLLDLGLKEATFFRTLPPIYQESEQNFLNLVDLLTSMLTFNFIVFVNENDLLQLHNKMKSLGYKSRDIKEAMRNYSENLVLVGKVDLINFQNMLDYI